MKKRENLTPEQEEAADPTRNVWVQANAGTGKTKVLVQRLLRILFRDSRIGHSSILCLTYTNAGAGEMRNRITAALRDWAMADDNDLRELLFGVSENNPPTDTDIEKARKVFFTYIDNPDILKIKTIHGFCQEILHRFPTEAGVSPSWSLVYDASQRVLLDEAFDRLFKTKDLNMQTKNAFEHIVKRVSEYRLDDLLEKIGGLYKGFLNIDNIVNYRKYFVDSIEKKLKYKHINERDFSAQKLKNIVTMAKTQTKSQKTMENIVNITEQYIENKVDFEEYKKLYLTDSGVPRKKILDLDFLSDELNRVLDIVSNKTKEGIISDTMAMFDLTAAFADIYQNIKQSYNVLDFDDLIWYTHRLFSNPETMGWVLSQMDLSLSHILIDEAQDTGTMQWQILQMLAGDFFADGDASGLPRSIFVVGDTKQSIYGFQGAAPDAFATSRQAIASQIKNNAREFTETPLTQSFRSVQPILDVVDCFFDNPNVAKSTGFKNNQHKCFRKKDKGCVEIHKLFEKDQEVNSTPMTMKRYLCVVADKIQALLKTGRFLPSDIMVLLRKRPPMAMPLINELKKRGIPVAGSDRIVLPRFPVIRDLMNLVRFCIDNIDDYSLACVLKSPMFALTDSQVFEMCNIRNTKNAELRTQGNNDTKITLFQIIETTRPDIYNVLHEFLTLAKTAGVYEFFSYVLNNYNIREKMVAALGNQILEPLEEFLTLCLAYERTQPGTLKQFLKWFIAGASEVKRDMESGGGVRVVSVHSSKGLQSRVVFLIDTTTTPKPERLINLDSKAQTNLSPWIWTPGAVKEYCPEYEAVLNEQSMSATQEDYRLLYVAMTRAQDELYIYGFANNGKPNELSWHTMLWNVLSNAYGNGTENDFIRITNEE